MTDWKKRIPFVALLGMLVLPVGCGDDGGSSTCIDGVQNGTETDVDCGGDDCTTCVAGRACEAGTDCRSGVCDEGVCTFGSCDDGVRNGEETDVDCGGIVCGACEAGLACERGADCVSLACAGGVCLDVACTDGRRNGDESDVDCGGSCAPCAPGLDCSGPDDCSSKLCLGGRCGASSCSDGLANGEETDVDCGGPDCRGCVDGSSCEAGTDCENGVCEAGTCVAGTCDDGIANGQEADVDCGRVCSTQCAVGQACRSEPDCVSGVCDRATDTCAAPSCTDFVANGDETDVDCGGGTCGGCDPGQRCTTGADCFDQICGEDGTCAPPACDDGFQNGSESDVDCGGECAPCADGLGCGLARDCLSGVCDETAFTCSPPACDDGVRNGTESDVDCGGDVCDGCPLFSECDTGADCESGTCSLSVCVPTGATAWGTSASYVGLESTPEVLPCPDPEVDGEQALFTTSEFTSVSVDLPFDFRFFGVRYSDAAIQYHGILSFDTGSIVDYVTSFNSCLLPYSTTTFPDVFIAAFWEDLEWFSVPLGNGIFYDTFGEAPNRQFVVKWNLPNDFTSGDYDVRVMLEETTNQVTICYNDVTVLSSFYSGGGSATTGVNNGEGREALQYSCNSSALSDGDVITYAPR